MKLYAFCYDMFDPKCSPEALLTYVKASRHIDSWASYTPGTVLIKSKLTGYELSEDLRRIINNAFCMCVELNPNNMGGWLPEQSWNWIREKSAEYDFIAALADLNKGLNKG
jgi:hypothetical protein